MQAILPDNPRPGAVATGARALAGGAGTPLRPEPGGPAFTGPRETAAPSFDRQWAAIIGIEAGTDAKGNFRTSPKGAVGPAQVMPGTAPGAARLAGIAFDPVRYRTDHDYNVLLGQAYYREQLRVFGDPSKAAAAYNAGPGSVKRGTGVRGAMARAERAGEPDNWEAYLPAETRAYVANFRKRTGAAAGEIELPRVRQALLDEQAEAPLRMDGLTPMHTGRFRPDEIDFDAALMQFKAGGDENGVIDTLRGVTEWSPMFTNPIIVWEALDGRRLVVDGHQRLALAKRLTAENPDAGIMLDATVLREADGVSAIEARVNGALKNMGEGSGTAIDAAKVIRDLGEKAFNAWLARLPQSRPNVRDALALARLSPDAFGAVVNKVLPPDQAAVIARLLPDDPGAHLGLIDLLVDKEPANLGQAESLVRQAMAAGFTRETQTDMFGTRAFDTSLFKPKARVLERGLAKLNKLRLVYGTAAREADTLEAAGSTIAREASQKEAQSNAEAIELIRRLAYRPGPIADALTAAALDLAGGGRIGAAVGRFVAAVRGLDLDAVSRDAAARNRDAGGQDIAGADGERSAWDAAAQGEGARGDDGDGAAGEGLDDAGDGPGLFADPRALALFDDPAGAGAKAQADSLEHDLRMDMEAGGEAPPGRESDASGTEGPDAPGGAQRASYPLRRQGIPDEAGPVLATFVEPVPGKVTAYLKVKAHPRYAAAKVGDEDAAGDVVRGVVTAANLDEARARFAGAHLLPVVAEEAGGRNKLPLALALHYERNAGLAGVDLGIVQSVRAHRTGKKGPARLVSRAQFDGPVVPGRRYVLVDDVITQGGTLAELANHVRAGGGEVVGVIAMASGSRSASLAPTPKLVKVMEERFGDVIRQELGIEPGALTFDEATAIRGYGDPDKLRAFLAKGRREGGGGADAGALRGGGGTGVAETRAGYRIGEGDADRDLSDIFDELDAEDAAAKALRDCQLPGGGE